MDAFRLNTFYGGGWFGIKLVLQSTTLIDLTLCGINEFVFVRMSRNLGRIFSQGQQGRACTACIDF